VIAASVFLTCAVTLQLTASRLTRLSRVSEKLPNWRADVKSNVMLRSLHDLCVILPQNITPSGLEFGSDSICCR
jgi:hypothetical protein